MTEFFHPIRGNNYKSRKLSQFAIIISFAIACESLNAFADEDIEFNTDVMDVKDRANIDLTHFARAGYIMPGDYQLVIHVNKTELSEQPVTYLVPDNDKKDSVPCLTADIVKLFGLKEKYFNNITWWHDGQCMDPASLEGMVVRGDLGACARTGSINPLPIRPGMRLICKGPDITCIVLCHRSALN